MIPKVIHYCWFGRGEKPKLAQKCIASWKKHCKDYQIIEWNEDNFDVRSNAYTRMCYENKKYAFLSDYVRLLVVAEHGGIYLDTDVEVLKPFDDLLEYPAYFGFENDEAVNTGLGFGAEPGSEAVKAMLKAYDQLLDGQSGTIGCPILNTEALCKMGLELNGCKQVSEHFVVFPKDFLNPYDAPTGRLTITDQTYSIHWFGGAWMSKSDRIRRKLMQPIHRIFGTNLRK